MPFNGAKDGKHYWLTSEDLMAIEDRNAHQGTGRHIAMFILEPRQKNKRSQTHKES
jgi:hypothetical protein